MVRGETQRIKFIFEPGGESEPIPYDGKQASVRIRIPAKARKISVEGVGFFIQPGGGVDKDVNDGTRTGVRAALLTEPEDRRAAPLKHRSDPLRQSADATGADAVRVGSSAASGAAPAPSTIWSPGYGHWASATY